MAGGIWIRDKNGAPPPSQTIPGINYWYRVHTERQWPISGVPCTFHHDGKSALTGLWWKYVFPKVRFDYNCITFNWRRTLSLPFSIIDKIYNITFSQYIFSFVFLHRHFEPTVGAGSGTPPANFWPWFRNKGSAINCLEIEGILIHWFLKEWSNCTFASK